MAISNAPIPLDFILAKIRIEKKVNHYILEFSFNIAPKFLKCLNLNILPPSSGKFDPEGDPEL